MVRRGGIRIKKRGHPAPDTGHWTKKRGSVEERLRAVRNVHPTSRSIVDGVSVTFREQNGR